MKKKILLLLFPVVTFSLSGCTPIKVSTNPLPTSVPTSNFLSPTSTQTVPLPTGEDIIRTFFELINEKRISEAVAMLSSTAAPDNSTKQAWSVTFNHFKSVVVEKIEESDQSSWTETAKTYKVTLNIQTDAPAEQIIWENGINIRWVPLKKVGNLWKIEGLATGP